MQPDDYLVVGLTVARYLEVRRSVSDGEHFRVWNECMRWAQSTIGY